MNGFAKASLVEARGLAILMPYLVERAHEGRVVRTSKGNLSKHLQASFGDVMLNTDEETVHSLEIKVEEENRTGNLFLETWSNRNLDNRDSHSERGSKPGWMISQRADFLLYYFLCSDELFTIPFFRLKRWAFGFEASPGRQIDGRIYKYDEKPQAKYSQLNDTWGRCVPISVLEKEIKLKRTSVRQLGLDFDDAG